MYLDQNKWIDLAKAAEGRKDGLRFGKALQRTSELADARLVSFPLTTSRYVETWTTRNAAKRHSLARVMLRLARPTRALLPDTMSGLPDILRSELRLALSQKLGLQQQAAGLPIFGSGVRHAFAFVSWALAPPSLTPASEQFGPKDLEFASLAGPPADFPVSWLETESWKRFNLSYQHAEEQLRDWFRGAHVTRQQKRNVIHLRALFDVSAALHQEMRRAGGPDPAQLPPETLLALVDAMPTTHADIELHLQRHLDETLKRSRTDLQDMAGVTASVVYCDVVVTERTWVHSVRSAGLDRHHKTVMIARLEDLPDVLEEHLAAAS